MSSRLLIIGPSWVGDTIMAQALFKLLKAQNPHQIIDILAPAWTFSLSSRMPEINQAIEMPFGHGELNLKKRFQIGCTLRNKYDEAIILPNSYKSALIPFFAKIPKRTGYLGEWRYGVLNDVRYGNKKKYPLMVEQYLRLGFGSSHTLPHSYPKPQLFVSTDMQEAVLNKHLPLWRDRSILAMAPGAEFGPAKRWPLEYYAHLANQKIDKGWDVWLMGSNKDRSITNEIMTLTQNRCENLAGRPNLAETIDLLSLVTGVVTNDSGLMHIAAALNKPVIVMYGPSSPSFTPPLSDQATILKLNLSCQPCFKRTCPLIHHQCMRDLKVGCVLDAMNKWAQ